jgi:hypothetical protein
MLLRGKPGRFLPAKLEMSDIAYDVLLDTGKSGARPPVTMPAAGAPWPGS